MTAYFGFRNLINEGVVTALEMPGFEFENAYDWFTYTWWRSSEADVATYEVNFADPITLDYFAVAAHNIDTLTGGGGRVRFQHFDGLEWVTLGTYHPTTNAPIFAIIPEIEGDQFRFIFDEFTGPAPLIGCLSFGTVLALPKGIRPQFTPPPAAVSDKIYNSESATGQFLGRSIEKFAYQIEIRQSLVDPAWIRANWYEVAQMLLTQPFFYTWNYEEYPQDAVYSWLDGELTKPSYTNSIFMEFVIKCRALHLIRWF